MRFSCFWSLALLVTLVVVTVQRVTCGPNEAMIDAQGTVNIADEGSPTTDATAATTTSTTTTAASQSPTSYGVDASWPMQQNAVIDQESPLSSEARQNAYNDYLRGCFGSRNTYKRDCLQWESDRLSMNRRQPAISQNYTHAGYAKVETPAIVRQLVQTVWEKRHGLHEQYQETWERPNTYLNHWDSPTSMIDISEILSPVQQGQLIQAVQSVLEAWTQQSLMVTSLYGIRIYGRGAILAPHVDRLPLVTSAIIQVDQQVDEDWPLEVIGRDGVARNLTCRPGDMILYESHSTIHGRPFALNGDYYANLFVHFEPVGHSMRHAQQSMPSSETAQASYERAWNHHQQHQQGQYDDEDDSNDKDAAPSPTLPYYVPVDKEARWRQQFEYEKDAKITPKPTKVVLGVMTNPHHAAADGLLHILKEIALTDRAKLFSKDVNGWTPLHEAARAGRTHVIQYLLDEGAQINERTNDGRGASPLWWAERNQRHDSVKLLKKHGGVSLAPNESVAPPKIPDPPKDDDDTTDETTEPEPKPKPFQTEHNNVDQE